MNHFVLCRMFRNQDLSYVMVRPTKNPSAGFPDQTNSELEISWLITWFDAFWGFKSFPVINL